jgi:hypothetical protein
LFSTGFKNCVFHGGGTFSGFCLAGQESGVCYYNPLKNYL